MAAVAHAPGRKCRDVPPASSARSVLPALTDAERAFWRRAVAAERERNQDRRPAPFPFQ
jgi:hypothetical protein